MLPKFLYIGGDKCGSSWIQSILQWHPQVKVPEAKELFFFDKNYDRGLDWYRSYFTTQPEQTTSGEVCHDYLYESECVDRIANDLPDAKLIVCVRDPVARTYSAYLFWKRHDLYRGSFAEFVDFCPEAIDRSCYGKYLKMYLSRFEKQQFAIFDFAQLQRSPTDFAKSLFTTIAVEPLSIPAKLHGATLPAALPRVKAIARFSWIAGQTARSLGFPSLVGKIKSSQAIQSLLYRKIKDEEKSQVEPEIAEKILGHCLESTAFVDENFGTNFVSSWHEPRK